MKSNNKRVRILLTLIVVTTMILSMGVGTLATNETSAQLNDGGAVIQKVLATGGAIGVEEEPAEELIEEPADEEQEEEPPVAAEEPVVEEPAPNLMAVPASEVQPEALEMQIQCCPPETATIKVVKEGLCENDTTEFIFKLEFKTCCGWEKSSKPNQTIVGNGSIAFTNLAYGITYRVVEIPNSLYNTVGSPTNGMKMTGEWDKSGCIWRWVWDKHEVTITNTKKIVDDGEIEIVKIVKDSNGDIIAGENWNQTFNFSLADQQIEIDGSPSTKTSTGLPYGSYTITETVPDGYTVDEIAQTVTIDADNRKQTVTFTNTKDCQSGSSGAITISKLVITERGDEIPIANWEDEFNFTIASSGRVDSFKLDKENPVKVYPNLPYGVYTITEISTPGYTNDNLVREVTLNECNNVDAVNFINRKGDTSSETCEIKIQKVIRGPEINFRAEYFEFYLTPVNNSRASHIAFTDWNGVATFIVEPGTYRVDEALTEEQARRYTPQEGFNISCACDCDVSPRISVAQVEPYCTITRTFTNTSKEEVPTRDVLVTKIFKGTPPTISLRTAPEFIFKLDGIEGIAQITEDPYKYVFKDVPLGSHVLREELTLAQKDIFETPKIIQFNLEDCTTVGGIIVANLNGCEPYRIEFENVYKEEDPEGPDPEPRKPRKPRKKDPVVEAEPEVEIAPEPTPEILPVILVPEPVVEAVEEVVEVTPQATLPKTGTTDPILFSGLGAALLGLGLFFRKKKEDE